MIAWGQTTSWFSRPAWVVLGFLFATQLAWSQSRSPKPTSKDEPLLLSTPARPDSSGGLRDFSGRWVVLVASVTVRFAPNASAASTIRLVRGSEILVAAREGNWLAVSMPPDGARGWIPVGSVERADIVAAGAVAFLERLKQQRLHEEMPKLQEPAEGASTIQAPMKTAEPETPASSLLSSVEDVPVPEGLAAASAVAQGERAEPSRERDRPGSTMSYMRAFSVPIFTFIQ